MIATTRLVLEFLSDQPLKASPLPPLADMVAVRTFPRSRMISLSEGQITRLLNAINQLGTEVVTDGTEHFLLMGAFACALDTLGAPLPACYLDGEVLGVDGNGMLRQWKADSGEAYTSVETLDVFGVENLTGVERVRCGLPYSRRPPREQAKQAIIGLLEEILGECPNFSMREEGNEDSAPNKCGWAFWVLPSDTTSYVHSDLSIEWYDTSWEPDAMHDDEVCHANSLTREAAIA